MNRCCQVLATVLAAVAAAAVATQGGASAQEPRQATHGASPTGSPTRTPRGGSESVSVGLTNRGRLEAGVALRDSDVLQVKRGSENARWGTAEMIAMVRHAAAAVARRYPGSVLNVGDISRRRGGRTRPHRSHRAGRDVDIGFYLEREQGGIALAPQFVTIGRAGRGHDRRGARYRFDAPRNWTLVEALLGDPSADLQYILVTRHIRQRLLDYAHGAGAPPDLVNRFRVVSALRQGSAAHRSHFHVRIYCASGDRPRCVDAPPFHPWVFPDPALTRELTRRWVTSAGRRGGHGARRGPRARRRSRHAASRRRRAGASTRRRRRVRSGTHQAHRRRPAASRARRSHMTEGRPNPAARRNQTGPPAPRREGTAEEAPGAEN